MASDREILEAAKAMILIGKERRENGASMPSRIEEAKVALEAAERIRSSAFRPTRTANGETFLDRGSQGCTEVDVQFEPDGIIMVTDIRSWKHDIDGDAAIAQPTSTIME